jgi:hypothetical protein
MSCQGIRNKVKNNSVLLTCRNRRGVEIPSEVVEMQANIPGAVGNGLPILFLHVRKLFKDNAQAGIVTETRLIARKEIPVKGIEGHASSPVRWLC